VKRIDSHIYASVGTVVCLLLLLLLLFKLSMTAPVIEEEEGIVVAFGTAEDGGGMPDATPVDAITQVEQIPAPAAPEKPSNNELMVQDDEESLALAKQREEDARRKALEEELIRQRREAEAKAEAERVAKEKALAEQRAKEQEAIDKANKLAALFGNAGTTEGGNGDNASASSSGVKGNPVGKGFGESNGNTWHLAGRDVKSLPKPSDNFNQQGRVIVNIRVDKAGNVVSATVADGTTVSDRPTQQLALSAARQAKFTEGDSEQIGSIVYNFKIN
jgi:TonB family protein